MSDTEEVVIQRKPRQPKNTKPEIAREKLKEKRERLKKEKDEKLIAEAKERLVKEAEAKKIEDEAKKIAEEEKKKSDPLYTLNSKLDRLVDLLSPKALPPPPPVEKPKAVRKPRAKKVVVDSEEEMPLPKPKVEKPKAPAKARKPRQKTVYEESPSNNFVGSAPVAPPQPVVVVPQNPLLQTLALRRGMNSFF
jgi:hypothetical protein